MPSFQLTKASFMSPDHRAFVGLVTQVPLFRSRSHRFILWLIPLLPGTDIMVTKSSDEVIGGLMLSRFQLPYWGYSANRTQPRKDFFKRMRSQNRRYASYAVVAKDQRGKGLFKKMMLSLTEPLFLICLETHIADSLRKLGAKNTLHRSLANGGQTCYQLWGDR